MPEHAVASDPLSLLTMVPELIGHEPRDSLVLLALDGNATCAAFRFDLPADSSAGGLRRAATTMVGMLCRIRNADGVLFVVYADDASGGGHDAPAAELVQELRGTAAAAGFALRDALYVTPEAWGSYSGRRGDRGELDAARQLRRLDPDAAPVGPSPREEAALQECVADDRRRTAEALAALRAEGDLGERHVDPIWFARYSSGWRPDEVGPVSAALTAFTLSQAWARDVVFCTWCWGAKTGERALRFQERYEKGEPFSDPDVAFALSGQGGLPRPRAADVRHAIEVLRRVAALLNGADRAPTLCALAWLSWSLGRSSVAGEYVRQSLDADSGYGLATLLHTMLGNGMLPQWAFRAESNRAERRREVRGGGGAGIR